MYHCTPQELEEIPEEVARLHFQYLMAERKHEMLESKKSEQKMKARKRLGFILEYQQWLLETI